MKYDFTSIIDRQGQDAMAVDGLGMYPGMSPSKPKGGFDFIPMWVADMNFPTVPTIPEAIIERAKHPAYGYFAPRDTYFDEIIKWHQKRNGVNGLKKSILAMRMVSSEGSFRHCSAWRHQGMRSFCTARHILALPPV